MGGAHTQESLRRIFSPSLLTVIQIQTAPIQALSVASVAAGIFRKAGALETTWTEVGWEPNEGKGEVGWEKEFQSELLADLWYVERSQQEWLWEVKSVLESWVYLVASWSLSWKAFLL